MAAESFGRDTTWEAIAGQAETRAAGWLAALCARDGDEQPGFLRAMRRDPESFEFTRRLLELLASTEDVFASAAGLREVAQEVPPSLPVRDRLAVRAGGATSLGLPWAVLPMARRRLRERVADLVLAAKLPAGGKVAGPARMSRLTEALRRLGEAGMVPVVMPLGEAVHGPAGAEAEVSRLVALCALPAVGHVVVDPARIAPGGTDWSAEDDVLRAVRALRPVLDAAAEHGTTVHLEPRSVRWARLLPEVVVRALADAALDRVRVGVRIMAELPESRELYDRISRWAQQRAADGGAAVEAVIGVAGVASAERIASIESGLPVPVLEDREQVTAQLLRLIELALHPGRAAVLRPVIASEDLFVLSGTVALAEQLGAQGLFSLQLRSGIAPGLAQVLADAAAEVRVSLPVVAPREFSGAVDLLVGFAAEAADPESVVARFDALVEAGGERVDPDPDSDSGPDPYPDSDSGPGPDPDSDSGPDPDPDSDFDFEPDAGAAAGVIEAERAAFRAAAALAADPAPASHRTQLRAREWDPSERDSALFYRAPDEPARFDTGGLTAAVLGLTRGSTGEVRLESLAPPCPIPVVSESGFAGEPATDASLAGNRDWVRALLVRAAEGVTLRAGADSSVDADSEAHEEPAAGAESDAPSGVGGEGAAVVSAGTDPAELHGEAPEPVAEPQQAAEETELPEPAEPLPHTARDAGQGWSGQPARARASRLRRAALAVVAARDRMLQTLAADTGAPAGELDAEVGDIVDAARYSGQLAEGLAAVRGATFVSEGFVLVLADAITPLSVQAESVLAALGAGNGVLWAVPGRFLSSAEALLEEWEVGGVTPGAVALETVGESAQFFERVSRAGIDRAIVLGDRAAAREIARRRPDLQIEGRFHARGTVLVAPSADLDRAIDDLVASAFSAAGAHPRTAQVAILLGSVGRSRRFRDGLGDAVRALRVGDTARPEGADPLSFDVGPLAAPAGDAALRALTELGRGEEWLVQPRMLDADGRLWSPGVRLGVSASSSFWDDARGVPVLGIAHAHTLDEALRLQNAVGGGVAAGLQSNDADEILDWLAGVEAASLTINRPTTAARIERHPGGAWNDAAMGLPALSGGPNRLLPLGAWQLREGTRSETLHLRGLEPEVRLLIEAAQSVLHYEEFDEVRRAALADALAWRTSFGLERDTIGLGIERNVIRYLPVVTQLRLAEGGSIASLVRVLAAALLVRAPVSVSTGEVLPAAVTAFLERQGVEVSLERDDDWVERLAVSGPVTADGVVADRVRLIGGDAVRAAEWMGGLDRVALWAQPVTMAGPVELLTLLREQSVSARAHRHGLATEVPGLDELIEE
ncbi:proline dehydrogenase family protein [Leucobacter chironomi]|uniref:proline dehydrogenase family protein n=1 Tax=Leucobacter chironomi TaxID=491918 RepID=UPI0004068C52|nr:proline dehydrogenase family protein [Leucobacter chironomi]